MIIRTSPLTVWLNSRLVHFPTGKTGRDIYAALAKHTRHVFAPVEIVARAKCAPRSPLPRHPFAALAGAIIHRLENPKMRASQRDATPRHARGSNARRKVVAGYSPAPGKKTVSFNGTAARPLSETDRAEVLGAVTLALLSAPTDPRTLCHALGVAYRSETPKVTLVPALTPSVELQKHGECFPCRVMLGLVPLSFAHWKQCFTAARATLGMKRKTARESLTDSLEALQATDFHSGLLEDESARAHREAERAAEAEEIASTRARVTRDARRLHALCQAAFRDEKARGERRHLANFRVALRHLRRAMRATLGEGYAGEAHHHRTAAHKQDRSFREYLAQGETQLRAEREAARLEREQVESVRLMFAVCD